MLDYLRKSISNGNPREQALIRRWWYESHGARGRMVWEYYLEGRYLDAVWFPNVSGVAIEESGDRAPGRFPLLGAEVVLCEAKKQLSPELVGQAIVYKMFATRAGAQVRMTVVLAEKSDRSMREVCAELGFTVVVQQLDMV